MYIKSKYLFFAQIERIIAEHHQILLSFKASDVRGGAEQVRDADDAGGVSDLANDPLLIKIAVSPKPLPLKSKDDFSKKSLS